MRRFFLPFLVIFFFVFESIVTDLLPQEVFGREYIIVPRFLLIVIMFITVYGGKMTGMLYGFIFGLIFDLVYTEIIGVYAFAFPLCAYFVAGASKILQTNIIVVSFISLCAVTLLELFVYGINTLIGVAGMASNDFWSMRLLPVLIFNGLFVIIASYPLKKYIEKWLEVEREDS